MKRKKIAENEMDLAFSAARREVTIHPAFHTYFSYYFLTLDLMRVLESRGYFTALS